MKKKLKDINIADIGFDTQFNENCSTVYIGTDVTSPNNVRFSGFHFFPGCVSNGDITYGWFESMDDVCNIDLEEADIAKKIRCAINEYKGDVYTLYKFYKYHVFDGNNPNVKCTPLYYIDDYNLNINPKEGSIVATYDPECKEMNFVEITNSKYHTVWPTVNSEEHEKGDYEGDRYYKDFYEWLTTTNQTYDRYFYGYEVEIDLSTYTCRAISNDSNSIRVSLGAKPGTVYLLEGVTFDLLQKRIINITKKLHDNITKIYKDVHGIEACKNISPVYFRGKSYSEWIVPKDIMSEDITMTEVEQENKK